MGSGIAQVCATYGFEVTMNDLSEELIRRGLDTIKNGPFGLEQGVQKGKVTREQADVALRQIKSATSLAEASRGSDLVIEAVSEDLHRKSEIFSELDNLCPDHTILASNTSTLSITALAAATKRPDRVIGAHFSGPAPVLKILEIIPGLLTSRKTLDILTEFATRIQKEIVFSKDWPGFIGNRILMPFLNSACKVLSEGIATKEDIDKKTKLSYGHPMGPFELMDLIGIDVVTNVLESIFRELHDPAYAPHPLLQQMVRAGLLGRKSGKGFYEYR
jgi:3-hydroxybutyryl-CoA dehydrogenase